MRCIYSITFLVLIGGAHILSAQTIESKSERSFSKIEVVSGTRTVTLTNDYGKRWKMRIHFPKDTPEKKSLVVALHWAGGGNTYKEFNDCLILPGLISLNAIIVSPEGENQLWSTGNNIDKVLSVIKNAQKYWNVDPKEIAVIGYSNGGNGSWYFAENYPDIFSAAVPMASAYPINKKIDVPLYVIHGAEDELFPIENTKRYIRKAREAGSEITFIVNEELSHFQGCRYVEDLRNASEWLNGIWREK